MRSLLIIFLSLTIYFAKGHYNLDSLKNELKSSKLDTNRVHQYIALASCYDFFTSKERIDNYVLALNTAVELKFDRGIKSSNRNLIALLMYRNMYDLAYAFFLDYIQYLESNHDTIELNEIENMYANLLDNMGKTDEAIKHFGIAKNYYLETENKLKYAYVMNNLSLLHFKINSLDSSFLYAIRGLELFKQINNQSNIANSTLMIAEIYYKKGEYLVAKERGLHALDLYITSEIPRGIIDSRIIISKIYNKLNEPLEALKNLHCALPMANDLKLLAVIKECNYELYLTHKNLKKPDSALYYFEQFKLVDDEIVNQNSAVKMLEMDVKYNLSQKELELNSQQQQIKNQKLQQNFLIFGILVVLILLFFAYNAYHQKKKSNTLIEEQKKLVEEKQTEILDSIHYASKIQKALLAHHDLVNKYLPESFLLYKPKDIVSGDFYWATETNENFYLAVCDSTGHGVPGAFMSLLSITFLNEAISEKGISAPHKVFNFVRNRIKEHIGKDGQRDGFDGVLFCFHKATREITYSSANCKPILISDGKLKVLESDRMPVGDGIKTSDFNLYSMQYSKNDTIYAFTDGFPDQFGGPKAKKFMNKQLNELLLENNQLPLTVQSEILVNSFNSWKGSLEQIDDVCLVGFKV